jgi:hypothetical protein
VAVLSSFLQVFDSESARRALINVGAGVRPGGKLYVIGAILDETRLAPQWGVWFNYAAISFYERGQAHTERECRGWLKEAGFDDTEFHLEDSAEVQIIARKSGQQQRRVTAQCARERQTFPPRESAQQNNLKERHNDC